MYILFLLRPGLVSTGPCEYLSSTLLLSQYSLILLYGTCLLLFFTNIFAVSILAVVLGIWTCFSCHRGHRGCQWISSHGRDSSQSSPSRLRGKVSGSVMIIFLGVLVTCVSDSEMLSVCSPSVLPPQHILSLFSLSNACLSCFLLKPWFYLTFLIYLLSVPFLMKPYCWPQACYSPDFLIARLFFFTLLYCISSTVRSKKLFLTLVSLWVVSATLWFKLQFSNLNHLSASLFWAQYSLHSPYDILLIHCVYTIGKETKTRRSNLFQL